MGILSRFRFKVVKQLRRSRYVRSNDNFDIANMSPSKQNSKVSLKKNTLVSCLYYTCGSRVSSLQYITVNSSSLNVIIYQDMSIIDRVFKLY